jgi:salicylate hydroxylase
MPIDRVCLWLGRRAHLVHYPVAQGAELNVVAIVEEDWRSEEWSSPGEAADIGARFAGWTAPARAIVAAAPLWQKFAVATVDPSAAWRDDRVLLIGDAAHAMPPFLAQGAATAIEDAAALADALSATGDTVAALSAYVAARRRRVIAVAAASRRAGARFHMSGVMAMARNAALKVAGERLILRESDAIYQASPQDPGSLRASRGRHS